MPKDLPPIPEDLRRAIMEVPARPPEGPLENATDEIAEINTLHRTVEFLQRELASVRTALKNLMDVVQEEVGTVSYVSANSKRAWKAAQEALE